jgi:hypothetical protein
MGDVDVGQVGRRAEDARRVLERRISAAGGEKNDQGEEGEALHTASSMR